jgi:hypothetical protein
LNRRIEAQPPSFSAPPTTLKNCNFYQDDKADSTQGRRRNSPNNHREWPQIPGDNQEDGG